VGFGLPALSPLGGEGGFRDSFKALSGDPDFEYAMIDDTIVRVHQHGAGEGRLSHGHLFEWDLGAAIANAARARLLQVGVAALHQAAPCHSRAGPGLIEVDEAEIPLRTKADPVCGSGGRSPTAKCSSPAPSKSKRRAWTPSPSRYQGLLGRLAAWLRRRQHRPWRDDQNRRLTVLHPRLRRPAVVGAVAAHIVLPWVHRAFSNAKTWALGVYHGLQIPHLQSYLDEFVFRFNRRRTRHAAFRSLPTIALVRKPHVDHAGSSGTSLGAIIHHPRS
jgi:ISXO2-like transposase domain